MTVDRATSRHADPSVRPDPLPPAAVRAGMRAFGHARADEFRQSRPRLVRHGGRLHHAGPGQPRRPAVLRRASHRLRRHRAHRGAVRAHALRARLQQEPPRPGALHHRPRLHVGRRGRLRDGIAAGLHSDPERAAGPLRDLRRRRRTLPAAHHRDLRAAHGRPAAHSVQHPLRQPVARLGRRPARCPRARHQRQRGLRLAVCRRAGPVGEVARRLGGRARWRAFEYAFWLAAVASVFLLPGRHLILTEIAWLALFALSLDLILGYAGIISLGHAAFFGLGSYVAALLAKHGVINEPVLALVVSGVCAAVLGFATSFLVLRGSDLTRLMVTLGVALIMREIANQIPDITGGADGLQGVVVAPILGMFHFDIFGHVSYAYCLIVLFVLFLLARRVVYSPFGLSLRAVKGNALRASSIGISVNARLVAIYTFAAFYAGVAGALLAQTTAFASLDVFSFERSADLLPVLIIGGTGYLYGGLIGAVIFKLMQDWIANLTPQYWQFWIGLVLVLIVLVGRERISAGTSAARALAEPLTRRFAPGAAPVPVPPGEGS